MPAAFSSDKKAAMSVTRAIDAALLIMLVFQSSSAARVKHTLPSEYDVEADQIGALKN